jgi:hypothetical protein
MSIASLIYELLTISEKEVAFIVNKLNNCFGKYLNGHVLQEFFR